MAKAFWQPGAARRRRAARWVGHLRRGPARPCRQRAGKQRENKRGDSENRRRWHRRTRGSADSPPSHPTAAETVWEQSARTEFGLKFTNGTDGGLPSSRLTAQPSGMCVTDPFTPPPPLITEQPRALRAAQAGARGSATGENGGTEGPGACPTAFPQAAYGRSTAGGAEWGGHDKAWPRFSAAPLPPRSRLSHRPPAGDGRAGPSPGRAASRRPTRGGARGPLPGPAYRRGRTAPAGARPPIAWRSRPRRRPRRRRARGGGAEEGRHGGGGGGRGDSRRRRGRRGGWGRRGDGAGVRLRSRSPPASAPRPPRRHRPAPRRRSAPPVAARRQHFRAAWGGVGVCVKMAPEGNRGRASALAKGDEVKRTRNSRWFHASGVAVALGCRVRPVVWGAVAALSPRPAPPDGGRRPLSDPVASAARSRARPRPLLGDADGKSLTGQMAAPLQRGKGVIHVPACAWPFLRSVERRCQMGQRTHRERHAPQGKSKSYFPAITNARRIHTFIHLVFVQCS